MVVFQFLKGAHENDGHRLLSRACCNKARGNGFNWKEGRVGLENFFYDEGAEELEQYRLCVDLSNLV